MEWDRVAQALQCERGIAGSILIEPAEALSMIRGLLSASDFTDQSAKAIYETSTSLIDSRKPCDANIIQAESGVEMDYCREVMMETVTVANAAEYAKIVHTAAQQRKASEIGSQLMYGELTAVSAVGMLQELLRGQSGGLSTPQEDAQAAMDSFSAAADGSAAPFLSTGFRSLDRMLSGGLANGGLITVAARPGTGKTVTGLAIAENVSASGKTVLYISLEMTAQQLWACRVANTAGLNRSDVLSGQIIRRGVAEDRNATNEENAKKLYGAFETLHSRPFYIHDKPATVEEIERKARCIDDLALLVVDHIGLIKSTGKSTRYEIMTGISHQLKQLALSLKIPVLALCQLNRASVQRSRPTMADLRDSGAIEEDSDVVILLHRDRAEGVFTEPIDFIIDKNRHGCTGILELGFCGAYSRIVESSFAVGR